MAGRYDRNPFDEEEDVNPFAVLIDFFPLFPSFVTLLCPPSFCRRSNVTRLASGSCGKHNQTKEISPMKICGTREIRDFRVLIPECRSICLTSWIFEDRGNRYEGFLLHRRRRVSCRTFSFAPVVYFGTYGTENYVCLVFWSQFWCPCPI